MTKTRLKKLIREDVAQAKQFMAESTRLAKIASRANISEDREEQLNHRSDIFFMKAKVIFKRLDRLYWRLEHMP